MVTQGASTFVTEWFKEVELVGSVSFGDLGAPGRALTQCDLNVATVALMAAPLDLERKLRLLEERAAKADTYVTGRQMLRKLRGGSKRMLRRGLSLISRALAV